MKKAIAISVLTVSSALAIAKPHSIDTDVLSLVADDQIQITQQEIKGLSPVNAGETADRLNDVMEKKGMRVFVNDDTSRKGRIEMQVLPGELLIYGSYRRAKSITRCSMDVLDDLPDMLVIETTEDGATIVTGNPESLGNRDNGNCVEVLAMLSDAMQDIVTRTVKG